MKKACSSDPGPALRCVPDVTTPIVLLDDKLFDWSCIRGHAQLTDIYLLGLAVRHKARLVALDRNIAINTVRRAKAQDLLVL